MFYHVYAFSFHLSRPACPAAWGILCLHSQGASGSLCRHRCLELSFSDSCLEISSSPGLWYGILLKLSRHVYYYLYYTYMIYSVRKGNIMVSFVCLFSRISQKQPYGIKLHFFKFDCGTWLWGGLAPLGQIVEEVDAGSHRKAKGRLTLWPAGGDNVMADLCMSQIVHWNTFYKFSPNGLVYHFFLLFLIKLLLARHICHTLL